jgi:hypothetical protein
MKARKSKNMVLASGRALCITAWQKNKGAPKRKREKNQAEFHPFIRNSL